MNMDRIEDVNSMVTYTNTFLSSIKKNSHRGIILFVEISIVCAIFAFATMHNTAAIGILLTAGVGVAMNLFTLDSYNRDHAEFEKLCNDYAKKYRRYSNNISGVEVSESIAELREASESYINKYKLISVINTITLAIVTLAVCLIFTSII